VLGTCTIRAGFTSRRYEFDHHLHRAVHHGTETSGKALEFAVLLLLGTMLTTSGLGAPGLSGWLLVSLLLLIIRPVLVTATAGRGFMDRQGQLFLGFFGVRGVAALFYATVVVETSVLTSHDEHVLVWTTIVCVVCSILVHGFSAEPLTRRWLERDRCPGTQRIDRRSPARRRRVVACLAVTLPM
jgi:NhaP-type Na+/H+ or K+/H+ antiporter